MEKPVKAEKIHMLNIREAMITEKMIVKEMPAEYVIRKGERYYLLPPFNKVIVGHEIDIKDKRFGEFVARYVNSYLKGEEVPLDIQAPIINAAEEFMAGKNISFRAGDYIALQNHLMKGK